MEKRVDAGCPSQCRGTSVFHTNQESWQRAGTTDSGSAPAPQTGLSDSNGSGVAARGVCSYPGVAPPVRRLPEKPLGMRTSSATHTPPKRDSRSARCCHTPCALAPLGESTPKLRQRRASRVWTREQDNPKQPKPLLAKHELHFSPVPMLSTTGVVVTIERATLSHQIRRHHDVRMALNKRCDSTKT